jgi:ribonuclease Z
LVEVFFIGTGAAVPSNERGLPAILIRERGISLLFDCGEGTLQRLMKLGMLMDINYIAISHLHADHFMGIFTIIQTMNMLGRKKPLTIISPKGINDLLTENYKHSYFYPAFDIKVLEGSINEDIGGLQLSSFSTCHTIESNGYLLRIKGSRNLNKEKIKLLGIEDWKLLRDLKEGKKVILNGKTIYPEEVIEEKKGVSVAYTGDTRPCDKVIKAVSKVSLLIHDSTFLDNEEAEKYGHSNADGAAKVAKEAEVERLALFHISSRYRKRDLAAFLTQARKIFQKTFVAEDFMYYYLR